jgi:ABC-2 type transport system permease protein
MMTTMQTMKHKGRKLFELMFVDKPDENDKYRKVGLRALYRKELVDYFRSKRFLIVLILISVIGLYSVYSAGEAIRSAMAAAGTSGSSGQSPQQTYSILNLFTESGSSWFSLTFFMSFLGPIVGLTLGFDAINGERSKRTLSRLLAQPIYRDAVINGKFLAGVTVIGIMVFSLGLIICGLGILMTGLPPTLDVLGRVLVFMIFTTVYISFWLALSQLFSLLFRHAATSALTGIALWLFFAIFLTMFAGLIANAVYPVSDTSAMDVMMNNYNLNHGLSRLSPTTLYNESSSVILDPFQRGLGVVTKAQIDRAIVGTLPLGQSLLLVWPHLTGLLALTMIVFAISYICFMKQEIRA